MTRCIIVSHTHWDREWYRPFEAFRARLVDTVDAVLDQLAADPGWSFVLDGQTVVIEDYLAIRPHRRAELEAACRAGRLAIGPWYVQPDSLLPAGETHVRNLLEGRRVGEAIGPVSRVGYTPDSFGHPAQFPQILGGFGITNFVYWRGNGAELDGLAPVWRWEAPDGTSVMACLLAEGYFAAAYLGDDPERAAARLEKLASKLSPDDVPEVLFMNGIDHAPPDTATGAIAAALAARTGWTVRRGLLDDHVATLEADGYGDAPSYTGELVGGRIASLLPGVWSTRTYLKQRNRVAENELGGWAEPAAALASAVGLGDERPSLRLAWRELLVNQAHDSICGCSTDAVHEHMLTRYDTATGVARETTNRLLERLSGLGPRREIDWAEGVDVAVWNPSPFPRTDNVRLALDGHPVFMIGSPAEEIHPLVLASLVHQGMTVDGTPARVVTSTDPGRVRLVPEQAAWDVEWVAADVPAFGWRRYRLAPGPASPPAEDDGAQIGDARTGVAAEADGTLAITVDGRRWGGLFGLEDAGDRGDSYDADPVDPQRLAGRTALRRRRWDDGTEELHVRRTVAIPAAMTADRAARSADVVELTVELTARIYPGVDRVDVRVAVDNRALDHRLRLLFPLGVHEVEAAATFDVVRRSRTDVDDHGWMQPSPPTFPVQGFITGGGLTIGAADLREAELLADGTLALTVLRSVGWLSQMDLHTRPLPAGPGMPTPGAQCLGRFETTVSVSASVSAADVRGAELGLRAVMAGDKPALAAGRSWVSVEPGSVVLSALKPTEAGGLAVRLLNPTEVAVQARVTFGLPVTDAAVARLDETVLGPAPHDSSSVDLEVKPHALATAIVVLGPAAP